MYTSPRSLIFSPESKTGGMATTQQESSSTAPKRKTTGVAKPTHTRSSRSNTSNTTHTGTTHKNGTTVGKTSAMPSTSGSNSTHVTSPFTNHTGTGNLTGTTGAVVSHEGGGSDVGTALAVVLTVIIVASLAVLTYIFLKKQGKLRHLPGFRPIRNRRSSTSDSTRVLPQETDIPDLPADLTTRDEDMFTIEEPEDEMEPPGEYFYDEVFGQSEFEDERTNAAVRDLYSTTGSDREDPRHGADDEMLDFDFETLGIKIEDYMLDPGRKHTV